MEWQSVSSSAIERVGYDSGSMTLAVEFKNGGSYHYFDVPETVFRELLSASSIGQYVAQHIKLSYRYSRM